MHSYIDKQIYVGIGYSPESQYEDGLDETKNLLRYRDGNLSK